MTIKKERYNFLKKHGSKAAELGIIPMAKLDWLRRYEAYLLHKESGCDNMTALFNAAEDTNCEFITAYKAVSFFTNLKSKGKT